MILGAMRFKMFGAFIGFFLGLFIEELIEGKSSLFGSFSDGKDDPDLKLSAYQTKLNRLLAALLKDQNLITKKESHFILKYFYRQFGTTKGKYVFQNLKEELSSSVDYIPAAVGLKTLQRQGKIQVVKFLFGLTQVELNNNIAQEEILEDIAKNMGVAQADFQVIKQTKRSENKPFVDFFKYTSIEKYYQTLGVQKGATASELKKAYRKLVLKYHPDKTELSKELATRKFQEVQEAYDFIRASMGIK